jgi:hypothetical protein
MLIDRLHRVFFALSIPIRMHQAARVIAQRGWAQIMVAAQEIAFDQKSQNLLNKR